MRARGHDHPRAAVYKLARKPQHERRLTPAAHQRGHAARQVERADERLIELVQNRLQSCSFSLDEDNTFFIRLSIFLPLKTG